MDFDEALARTVNLLERQGFATYRTLKRRFHLDDATLEALKTALVDTQHLATDDGGTRLVWLGELRPGSGPTRLEEEDAPPVTVAPPPTPATGHRAWTPLVGREAEVALLQARWPLVQAGQGQVILLGGEAGIGKSRLVQVVKAQAAEQPHQRWECRCDPALQHSALAPLIELLQRGFRFQPDEPPAGKLQKLADALAPLGLARAEVVPLLATLLSVPLDARYPLPPLVPAQQKQQTLAAIGTLLAAVAAQTPVLLIVEDLHWADASTLELLTLLVERVQTLRCYVLLTHRPEFQAPWAPSAYSTALTLQRLAPAQVEALATQVAGGKALPAVVLAQILARTEGVPLFVEEVTQMVLESGLLVEQEEAYVLIGPLPALALPATVQESVRARLASLGGVAQQVAQGAAVWGRAVTEVQLQATVGLAEGRRDRALGRLVAADILYELSQPPRVTYVFKHALLQEAAYAMVPDGLRLTLHAQVAQYLVEREPETVATQPERVAQHYTAAGLTAQAVLYWQQAGQRAHARAAPAEAVVHFTQGLALLPTLPDGPERVQHELALLTALGVPLVLTRGHAAPEVETIYARARELCRQLGDAPQLFSALLGLMRFYFHRGELATAHDLGEELLRLAGRLDDAGLVVRAHVMLAEVLLWLGEFARARAHAEQGLALYDFQQHRDHVFRFGNDSGVCCRFLAAMALWVLGYPDQALRRIDEALAWAQELAHPFTLGLALQYAARLHQLRREVALTHARVEALIALATEQGFAMWIARGPILRGWALAAQGQAAAGLAKIRQGTATWQAMGAQTRMLHMTYDAALMADVYGQMDRPAEGLTVLTEALALAHPKGERFCEAELHRLQGVLRLQSGVRAPKSGGTTPQVEEAEVCFRQGLEIARDQQAKSLELRAAMSLARLWQQQGKRAAARELLAPIYGWFTEGFDTADLQEAKALLEALR